MPSGSIMIIVAALSWGLWGICDKLAVRTMHPAAVQLVNVIFGACAIPAYWLILKQTGGTWRWDTRAMGWSLLGALTTGTATLAYIFALQQKDATTVVGLVSVYPAVTMMLAAFILGEAMTLQRVSGLCLVLGGVWLLSR